MTASSPLPAEIPPAPAALLLRPERADDDPWIENLHAVSFGPGRFARAAFRVRERIPLDPELCFVAEIGGERAASVRMTPVSVGGRNGYLLGPLMTDPHFRKQGAGRTLVTHVCALALAKPGIDFVLLVGDSAYYGPLGFVRTVLSAIRFPAPVDPARILALTNDADTVAELAGDVLAQSIASGPAMF